MTAVLDSSALIALFRAEAGWDVVLDVLTDPENSCHVHAINLCEVFYKAIRDYGQEQAISEIGQLQGTGLTCHTGLDAALWIDAGHLKATYRRVSLADCFGVALARKLQGVFVTSDHHELDALNALGVCDIQFIR